MNTTDSIVVTGDLILLSEEDRIKFYVQTCNALGLDFRTRPLQYFEQIDRNGKRVLILYALRSAAAQLALIHHFSVMVSDPTFHEGVVMFKASVFNPKGRTVNAMGAVSLKGLEGKAYADAILSADTKSRRRAILDAGGCGLLDESEIEGMNGSVIEVTDKQLEGFVPMPSVPEPAPSGAPVTEVLELKGADAKVFVEAVVNPPEPSAELKTAVENYYGNKMTDPEKPSQDSMEAIFARLSKYFKDVLPEGGLKPSKGLGIKAKWTKFLSKHAPSKNVEEYTKVLAELDFVMKAKGAAGIVEHIEKEIA